MAKNIWQLSISTEADPGIPFYSTASPALSRAGSDIYRSLRCKDCHSLWTVRNMLEFVPAPALDGIGSLRNEAWFYAYFSAQNPQSILPTRLKQEYQMPSYAHLPEQDRRVLAAYMASLKVKDWYLEETKKAEYEKLTGKDYPADAR
ncbi:MAG: c-type cytochrome [Gammaproteobacteria bacterium]